jgi:hypothetical protein
MIIRHRIKEYRFPEPNVCEAVRIDYEGDGILSLVTPVIAFILKRTDSMKSSAFGILNFFCLLTHFEFLIKGYITFALFYDL